MATESEINTAKDRVTVVIPVKNEAPTLAQVMQGAAAYCSQIIVVDGCSTDGSPQIAKNAGALCMTDHGKGKGEAIRCAIPHISSDVTVFIDADGSHDPGDIPRLVRPILADECDHVTGSRLIGGSSELHGGFDEFFRISGSSFITACINRRFGVRLSDSQNGFRAIRTSVLRQLELCEDITTIEQEMIIKTLKKGFRMGEVPSHEHARMHGISKVRISRDWLRYGWSLAKGMI